MKKNKREIQDDGHTVYPMNNAPTNKPEKESTVGLTKKERRSAIKAGLETYLPILLILLVSFGLVMLGINFWLS